MSQESVDVDVDTNPPPVQNIDTHSSSLSTPYISPEEINHSSIVIRESKEEEDEDDSIDISLEEHKVDNDDEEVKSNHSNSYNNNELTYKCYICMEENLSIYSSSSYKLENCGHRYCSECLANFLQSNILDGRVQLKCFYPITSIDSSTNALITLPCNQNIKHDEILYLLTKEYRCHLIEKYERFVLMKSNIHVRECPSCHAQNIGNPTIPLIICTTCGQGYCYYHSNAHSSNVTCEEYESQKKAENDVIEDLLNKTSKKCPGCGAYVSKSGGCNHMKVSSRLVLS